jgi:triphosphoribosyl-dephospho-CoA synthase
MEEAFAAGRLLDVDVYDAAGRQVDRRSIGLPPRLCLACDQPAVDCIRAGRHSPGELAAAVSRLLHADERERLAGALVRGARLELELTPKPGLVDRLDSGSHPDLSFDLMSRSIDLLPEYYGDLIRLASTEARPLDLAACVAAGRRAEARMLDAIGTNAHRGYIFLSGLVLLGWPNDVAEPSRGGAAANEGSRMPAFRRTIADLAKRTIAGRVQAAIDAGIPQQAASREPQAASRKPQAASRRVAARAQAASHGAEARARYGTGGILGEALAGLPAIFEHGLPALAEGLARFGPTDAAHHWLMAALMAVVEDTTSLHRCGRAGLDRLKADGRRIREAMEAGEDHVGTIARLNDDYRAMGLTMGGVADSMAVTIALRAFEEG